MRILLLCLLLTSASNLFAQDEPEWIKQLGFIHEKEDLLSVFESDQNIIRLEGETPNRVSLLDTELGVEYDMFFDAASGYGFIYQLIFLSENSLATLDRYATHQVKGFTGRMPFGLRTGMTHDQIKEKLGVFFYSGASPERVQYKDIMGLGKDSEMEFRFNNEGLQYLRLLVKSPATINQFYQAHQNNFEEVLKASYQATVSWYGSFFNNLVSVLNDSRGYIEKPINNNLGGANIQSNESKWRASWCDKYPEISKARFDQLVENITIWANGTSSGNGQNGLVIQNGKDENEVYWVAKTDVNQYKTFNEFEVFRVKLDQSKNVVFLENIHSEFFNKQQVIEVVGCK